MRCGAGAGAGRETSSADVRTSRSRKGCEPSQATPAGVGAGHGPPLGAHAAPWGQPVEHPHPDPRAQRRGRDSGRHSVGGEGVGMCVGGGNPVWGPLTPAPQPGLVASLQVRGGAGVRVQEDGPSLATQAGLGVRGSCTDRVSVSFPAHHSSLQGLSPSPGLLLIPRAGRHSPLGRPARTPRTLPERRQALRLHIRCPAFWGTGCCPPCPPVLIPPGGGSPPGGARGFQGHCP